jgi:cytochrome c nitrite reductase small subunit
MTSPARRVRSTLAALAVLTVGAAAGLGLYTFVYARGYAYLGHASEVCINCHAMNDYYAGWLRGSHRQAAQCADCHTPFNPVGKYAVKAWDGFWHSYYFTTNTYPDVIQPTRLTLRVAEGQCRACHQPIVENITAHGGREGSTSCIRCHATVGHW